MLVHDFPWRKFSKVSTLEHCIFTILYIYYTPPEMMTRYRPGTNSSWHKFANVKTPGKFTAEHYVQQSILFVNAFFFCKNVQNTFLHDIAEHTFILLRVLYKGPVQFVFIKKTFILLRVLYKGPAQMLRSSSDGLTTLFFLFFLVLFLPRACPNASSSLNDGALPRCVLCVCVCLCVCVWERERERERERESRLGSRIQDFRILYPVQLPKLL